MKLKTAYKEVFLDPDFTLLAKILFGGWVFLVYLLFQKEPSDEVENSI